MKMYDIITIGSATTDLFVKANETIKKHENHFDILYHLGQKILIDDLIMTSGGGGTNTAVAFSRLGMKTAFFGVVGTDNFGEDILKELYAEKVEFIGKVKEGKTGLSIIIPGKEDRVILSYKGVNNSLALEDIHNLLFETKWLYISTMLGKSKKAIISLLEMARRKNIKVAMNISDYLARQGTKKLSNMLSNTDVLVLNDKEASLLTGKKDIRQNLQLLSEYAKTIAITSGAGSVFAISSDKVYMRKVKKIKPVDTTGAGDAFAAGFVYGVIKNKDISSCLDYGCREALSVLKQIGAKNDLLYKL